MTDISMPQATLAHGQKRHARAPCSASDTGAEGARAWEVASMGNPPDLSSSLTWGPGKERWSLKTEQSGQVDFSRNDSMMLQARR